MLDGGRLSVLNAGQNYWIRGGSDRCLIDLGELLEARGHRVIPFAVQDDRNLPTEWSRYFPPAVNFDQPGPRDLLRYLYSPEARRQLERLLSEHRVDVAQLHIYYGQLTGSIFAPLRRRGIPVVQTLHEFKIVCPVYALYAHGQLCQKCDGHAFWKATTNRCNRGSLARSALSSAESYLTRALGAQSGVDHFMAVSQFVKDKVVELGVPADKVSVVHNFVDAERFSPSAEEGTHFLYFGRLDRTKGTATILDMAERLPDLPFLVAGEGAARAGMEADILARGLTNVRLLGFQTGEALSNLIRGAIAIIAPSEVYETFGLSAAEAMAHGRPVVAHRIGGLAEVVENGVDGFLVEPGDRAALAEKLRWLADNRAAAAHMGQAGRANVIARFGPDIHYRRTMAVYRRVLAGKPG